MLVLCAMARYWLLSACSFLPCLVPISCSHPHHTTPTPHQHSLLRRHPSPSRERFEPLIAAVHAAKGLSICVDDSRALQQSLDAAVDPGGDPYVNKIIRIMATRYV